jgi:hypothetical protein
MITVTGKEHDGHVVVFVPHPVLFMMRQAALTLYTALPAPPRRCHRRLQIVALRKVVFAPATVSREDLQEGENPVRLSLRFLFIWPSVFPLRAGDPRSTSFQGPISLVIHSSSYFLASCLWTHVDGYADDLLWALRSEFWTRDPAGHR